MGERLWRGCLSNARPELCVLSTKIIDLRSSLESRMYFCTRIGEHWRAPSPNFSVATSYRRAPQPIRDETNNTGNNPSNNKPKTGDYNPNTTAGWVCTCNVPLAETHFVSTFLPSQESILVHTYITRNLCTSTQYTNIQRPVPT